MLLGVLEIQRTALDRHRRFIGIRGTRRERGAANPLLLNRRDPQPDPHHLAVTLTWSRAQKGVCGSWVLSASASYSDESAIMIMAMSMKRAMLPYF